MSQTDTLRLLKELAIELDEANIAYQYIGTTALLLQSVPVEMNKEITIRIQWDQLEAVYEMFQQYQSSEIKKDVTRAEFHIQREGHSVVLSCLFNIAIKADPYRISLLYDGVEVWCQSLYTYLFETNGEFKDSLHRYLYQRQQDITAQNEVAWNQNNYQALLNRFGEPSQAAAKLKQNPKWRLHPFYKYMGDVKGKRIVHLLGSNGIKGTALALLGAQVTVVDFSKENQKFALEVAGETGVEISYIVSDVLSVLKTDINQNNDIVLMELGVLHYFIDLSPLAKVISELLKDGGMFVLHEFHPISTKLITSNGKKHKVTGNYFDPMIHTKEVAFTKHMDETEGLTKVLQRYWTIGEIVTALAKEGLFVHILEEEPNHKLHDIGLPKTFTLCAKKH